MCESNAYLRRGKKEELFLKDVTLIKPISDRELLVENLLGEQKTIKAKISQIDFMAHKIVLSPEE
jgi:predicted RNA-binding protein